MSAGLTLLTDEELARLRERIVLLSRATTLDQRTLAAAQLEDIDLEQDRRVSTPPMTS